MDHQAINLMRLSIALVFAAIQANIAHGADTPQELAQLVISQIATSRNRLQSSGFTYSVDYVCDSASGRVHTIINGEWRQSGKQTWVKYKRAMPEGAKFGNGNTDEVLFIGMHSSGFHVLGTINAAEYEHDDMDRPSDRERALVYEKISTNNPILFAFGTGSRLLSPENVNSVPWISWEATRRIGSNHDNKYVLSRFVTSPSVTRRKDMELEVDPTRGWMVVHRKFFDRPGHLRNSTEVTPTRISDQDIWYPARIVDSAHGIGRGAQSGEATLDINVFNFRLANWPETQFSSASLNIPLDTHLIQVASDGKRTSYVKKTDGLKLFIREPHIAPTSGAILRARKYVLLTMIIVGLLLLLWVYAPKRRRGGLHG